MTKGTTRIIPFTQDKQKRRRRIVYDNKTIAVVLMKGGADVTGELSRDELNDVVARVTKARNDSTVRAQTVPDTTDQEAVTADSKAVAPDYKALYEQALTHLRAVSGSRNSFTKEAQARLFDLDQPRISLRTPEVEAMHNEAVAFLAQHDATETKPLTLADFQADYKWSAEAFSDNVRTEYLKRCLHGTYKHIAQECVSFLKTQNVHIDLNDKE